MITASFAFIEGFDTLLPDREDHEGRSQAFLEAARWNTQQGHYWTHLGEGPVRGLIYVNQPLTSSSTPLFSATFPFVDEGGEKGGSIRPHLLFDSARLERIISNNYSYIVDATRFQNDPARFAAAMDAALLPHVRVEWTYYYQLEYTGPELIPDFSFEFFEGPPRAQLDHSNSLALTEKQMFDFSQGYTVSLWSPYELKMDPIIVYSGGWRAIAYLCQATAWNNDRFYYVVASRPM